MMNKKRSTTMDRGATQTTSPVSATADGTMLVRERHGDRYDDSFYREGWDGLRLSSLGIGTYLGECDDAEDARYRETLMRALGAGVNVVDTAINYRCQRSERAVGDALRSAIGCGIVEREGVLVCTKGGFIPLEGSAPASREAYRQYLQRTFFEPGIMSSDDVVAGGHSLAPGFLRWSIARSRRNLGVEMIDLYHLHNPEQQAAVLAPPAFRARLRAAFMVLEDAVSRGEIAAYGCATWSGFRVSPSVKGHLAIADLVATAREVAGDGHHLRAVQLPLNLAMTEAVRAATQPATTGEALVPAVACASDHGLSVFISASLMQAQLTRALPDDVRRLFPRQTTDAQRALSFVRGVPGVTTALVGTRERAHLDEDLASAAP